ncbi:uncharacterized protein CDAR_256681 [Caerostris darwini]|uniref:Uncharacterized protein n=1 Tax=Caerostris darwini TaxID=1538125 RepID=A0AAV4Q0M8_9ARAC|nr:uncharacterized protein CDAR_256681 [Caerostris darwini]
MQFFSSTKRAQKSLFKGKIKLKKRTNYRTESQTSISDSVTLSISDEILQSTESESEKKLLTRLYPQEVNAFSHQFGEKTDQNHSSNANQYNTCTEAITQTEDWEKDAGVQVDAIPKKFSPKSHQSQFVQTDYNSEKLINGEYHRQAIRRGWPKNFNDSLTSSLTNIYTLPCIPVWKQHQPDNISHMVERTYRLTRWLSEGNGFSESTLNCECKNCLPKVDSNRKNVEVQTNFIPTISRSFGNRINHADYNYRDNYSDSTHDQMITHFDAFQFLHAPRIKTQTRRNAMVQTDPHSQNSPDFHPVRRNYFMRTLEQSPTFITRNSSPLKIIGYDLNKAHQDKTSNGNQAHVVPKTIKERENAHFLSDIYSANRTICETNEKYEKMSPIVPKQNKQQKVVDYDYSKQNQDTAFSWNQAQMLSKTENERYNFADFHPDFNSTKRIICDTRKKGERKSPITRLENKSPPKIVDSDFHPFHQDKAFKGNQTQASKIEKETAKFADFHPDLKSLKRTICETNKKPEGRSPLITKQNYSPRNKCYELNKGPPEKISKNIKHPIFSKVETEQNLPITQTKNAPKTAIESHQKFHQLNTRTEEKHPNHNLDSGYPLVKRRDGRFQNTSRRSGSPRKMEDHKPPTNINEREQKETASQWKRTETFNKIANKQDIFVTPVEVISRNRLQNNLHNQTELKLEMNCSHFDSDYNLKEIINFPQNGKQANKSKIITRQNNSPMNFSGQESLSEFEEVARDKIPVWKRAQMFSKIINEHDMDVPDENNPTQEQKENEALSKPEPIQVRKNFSNYLKGQYRNLEDETVGKSYMMIQDLKEVLQKRGVAN